MKWILILGILSSTAFADVKFYATVDANQISEDENVTLTLVVESNENNLKADEPRLPVLDGFELSSKWDQFESSSQFVNGKFEFVRRQIYKYLLTPQRKGNIVIGPAEAVVNGSAMRSQPITVSVLESGAQIPNAQQGQRGRPGQPSQPRGRPQQAIPNFPDPFDDEDDLFAQLLKNRGFIPNGRGGARSKLPGDNQAFFVQVEVDKTKVYVGEQVTASWYLYTTGAIKDYDALKYPSLNGFWKEELELANRLNFQSEVVNGIAYNKALLVSYALFPIKEGRKMIDPYKAKATVISSDSGMAMFGIGRPYTYTKVSQEVPIEVMPLPTEGRPASFSGAVGSFDVVAQLSSQTGKVNQPLSLKIKFQGEGNAKAIELPPLNLPSSIEMYDTKSEAKFFKTGQSFKDFEVLLIPRSTGEVIIPPIAASWFDPKTKKYITKSTQEFKIRVIPGDGSAPSSNVPLAADGGEAAKNATPKDIRFIHIEPIKGFPIKKSLRGWLWALAYLAVVGLFGWRSWNLLKGPESSALRAKKRAQAKLKAAKKKLKDGDWRGVGTEAFNAVLGVLGEVVGTGGASLEASQLVNRLSPAVQKEVGEKLLKLTSQCELLSFAPEALVGESKSEKNLKQLLSEAERLIISLMKDEKVSPKESGEQAASLS